MDLSDGTYRLSTCRVVYDSYKEKGIECFVGADFDSEWAQSESDNAKDFMSRTGYVTMYAVCRAFWYSNLQA